MKRRKPDRTPFFELIPPSDMARSSPKVIADNAIILLRQMRVDHHVADLAHSISISLPHTAKKMPECTDVICGPQRVGTSVRSTSGAKMVDKNESRMDKMQTRNLDRRCFLFALTSTSVAAFPAMAHEETPFELPVDYLPTLLDIDAGLPAGEIHVFPDYFRLFLTLPDQKAIRYTVGVGRPGLYHAGQFRVGAKQEWPSWRPTPQMIARDPDAYAQYAEGMPGGVDNPLGARALYLHDDQGRDTYLRIHGTNKPETIGTAVSNGCARLENDHITDLYDRVPISTPVFLYPQRNV